MSNAFRGSLRGLNTLDATFATLTPKTRILRSNHSRTSDITFRQVSREAGNFILAVVLFVAFVSGVVATIVNRVQLVYMEQLEARIEVLEND